MIDDEFLLVLICFLDRLTTTGPEYLFSSIYLFNF